MLNIRKNARTLRATADPAEELTKMDEVRRSVRRAAAL
jgi:hypothetical protein